MTVIQLDDRMKFRRKLPTNEYDFNQFSTKRYRKGFQLCKLMAGINMSGNLKLIGGIFNKETSLNFEFLDEINHRSFI